MPGQHSRSFAQSATDVPATTQPSDALRQPLVSVHLENVPREQILDEFAHQSHMSFENPADGFWNADKWPTPIASLDIDDEPFWTALSHLQEATDLGFVIAQPRYGVVLQGDQQHITPTRERGDWGWTGRPEAACGPMLLSVRQVDRKTTVPSGDAASAFDQISLRIVGFVHPHVDWTIDTDGFEMSSLKTDQGAELQSQSHPAFSAGQVSRGQCACFFAVTAAVDEKIAWVTLQGRCHGTVVASHQKIELQDAENSPLDETVAGLKVHVETLRSARGIQVRMSSKLPAGADQRARAQFHKDLARIWQDRVHLFDSAGRELLPRGVGFPARLQPGAVQFDLSYLPASAPSPLKLVWDAPTSIQSIVVPIQIEQIPVP